MSPNDALNWALADWRARPPYWTDETVEEQPEPVEVLA